MEDASDKASKVQAAKENAKREEDMFTLKKRQAELQIDEAELSLVMTKRESELQRSLLKEQNKQYKTILDGKRTSITMEEQNQKDRFEQSSLIAKNLAQRDPNVQSMIMRTINPTLNAVGPQGRMIQGQSPDDAYSSPHGGGMIRGRSPDDQQTPEAIDIMQDIPYSRNQPYLKGGGKVGYREERAPEITYNRLQDAQSQGISLTEEELSFMQKQRGIDTPKKQKTYEPKQHQVVALAEKMAKTQYDNLSATEQLDTRLGDLIKKNIPEAKQMLTGEGSKDGYSLGNLRKGNKSSNHNANQSRDGKVRMLSPDGKYGWIPKSNVKRAEALGAKLVK